MGRIVFSLFLLALAWGLGFYFFISSLPRVPSADAPSAEGVVVYTGGGARIAAGMLLLQNGSAGRLLISGVNPGTSKQTLADLWEGDAQLFDCCVDLGLEARSTEGNAVEVRDWARSHGFSRLILVTSDYHMPRALLETRARLSGADIIAYPVSSGYLGGEGAPADPAALGPLAYEYSKYLAAHVTSRFRRDAVVRT